MGFLADIFYFVVVIAILVVIHELGHFLAAKMSGMRADIFSVGMGNRLFGYNKVNGFTWGKLPEDYEHKGQTDYRLSAFPIGGYVKIAGMVDESMDTDYKNSKPQPWEFRSKNTFQKAFVLSAGVLMNFFLAVAIFAGIVFFRGESSFKTTEVGYVSEGSVAEMIGLAPGDDILSVNGHEVTSWNEIIESLTTKDFGKNKTLKVERNGDIKTLKAGGDDLIKNLADQGKVGIDPKNLKTVILSVESVMPAGESGLQAYDTVLALNGQAVNSMREFINIVQSNPEKQINIKYKRDSFTGNSSVTPTSNGKVGVGISHVYSGEMTTVNYGFLTSVSMGFNQTISSIDLFFSSIGQIFKGNLSFKQSVGGPIMIAQKATEHAEQGLISFLSFMALLSISLAIINILPFPALDGGHLVFVVIEGIIRREIPVKIKMGFQQGGIIILLLFMLFVIYIDIMR